MVPKNILIHEPLNVEKGFACAGASSIQAICQISLLRFKDFSITIACDLI
jgi:hypothetical protein